MKNKLTEEQKEEIKEEILIRIQDLENGDSVNVEEGMADYRQFIQIPLENRTIQTHKIDFDEDGKIVVMVSITKHPQSSHPDALEEGILELLEGDEVEELWCTEAADSETPIQIYYEINTRVDVFLKHIRPNKA